MLADLHVKNLALIEEDDIPFGRGLNVLSGETGAGKSIILGALGIALGQKAPRDMLRDPDKDGLVEAVFTVDNDRQRKALEALEIISEDDEVILSRRITGQRTISRINGETVPAAKLREAGDIFIDIYGQNEHQSLMHKDRHLAMLDEYAREKLAPVKEKLADAYRYYVSLKKEYDESSVDESERLREISFLSHEVEEISGAGLTPGEDEEVENAYRRMNHASRIAENMNEAYHLLEGDEGAHEMIGSAMQSLEGVAEYDPKIEEFISTLTDVDSILSDFSRDISSYMEDAAFDEEKFRELEERLDVINDLKAKYGSTIEIILDSLADKQKKLDELTDYDAYREDLKRRLDEAESALEELCRKASKIRRKAADELCSKVEKSLASLNFLSVKFSMHFARASHYSVIGYDEAEFYISTNPGEPQRPLKDVASGGEMSRIMLALKTELAMAEDTVDTLIFDEIDAGISGRTAQTVARKLHQLAAGVQVICITHLALIAAYADSHFFIEKNVVSNRTISGIRELSEDGSVREIARMIAGDAITDSVLVNAREMREAAHS